MSLYSLKQTKRFTKEFGKLSKEMRLRFYKQLDKVKQNPFGVGKPLNSKYFRELKNEGFRLYFWVQHVEHIVWIMEVSNKKKQPKAIAKINKLLKNFQNFLKVNKNI